MKKFTLSEILNSYYHEPPCLIQKLVWEQDNIIVLGDAKVGKSILSQQLAFSATSGDKFLDQYQVYKTCRVVYVQGEGKMFDTISRCKHMAKEVPHKANNLLWFYVAGLPLDRPHSVKLLMDDIGDFNPDIIFFDPLYMLKSKGSLRDDDIASQIVMGLNKIKEKYDCAIIVNHHQHRAKLSPQTGELVEEGDNSIFGSFVWKAWPDHIILLTKPPNADPYIRKLQCDTQRSGKALKNQKLRLIQPNPLLFEVLEDNNPSRQQIIRFMLKAGEVHYSKIAKVCKLSESTVKRSLRQLAKEGIVDRPKAGVYVLKEETND